MSNTTDLQHTSFSYLLNHVLKRKILTWLLVFFFVSNASIFASGTLAGTVISDQDGTPLVGAAITLLKATTTIASGTTDTQGRYTIAGLTADYYVAKASASGYQSALATITVHDGQDLTLNFALLAHPATVEGTVIDVNTGLPLAGCIMEVKLNSGILGLVLTDNAGHYTINGIPPGSYTLYAFRSNYQTGLVGVTLRPDQIMDVNFSLPAQTGSILGFITDANTGLPIAGAVVEVQFNNNTVYAALTDASGKYKITGVLSGSYTVCARAFGYQMRIEGSEVKSNIAAVASLALLPDPGTVSGIITSIDTGLPLSYALVTAKLNNTIVSSTFTDGQGLYTINGLDPQFYTISVYLNAYQSASTHVTIQSDQTTFADVALLSNPGSLTGLITSFDTGQPIPNAFVAVNFNQSTLYSTLTDASGRYQITGVIPNFYTISVQAQTYQIGVANVGVLSDQTSEVDVALRHSTGAIQGRFVDLDTGLPVASLSVNLFKDGVLLTTLMTDKRGACDFQNLESGDYVLKTSNYNYNDSTTQAHLDTGAHIVVRVTMVLNHSPPRELTIKISDNHFLLKSERIYELKWQPSPSNHITKYHVYRNGMRLGALHAGEPLTYSDRCRTKGKRNIYSVVAVTRRGVESEPVYVSIH